MGTTAGRTERFFTSASTPGIVLALSAAAALVAANSPLAGAYQALLDVPGEVRIGASWLVLAKPLSVWVNDLWMAFFFLLVGLEIKRELLAGELASPRRALLPAVAALGGMVVPALVYAAINRHDAVALGGWAIPMATDIAFALGVAALLGPRVPSSLKVFLMAVAVIDDLGAIAVIGLFYTERLVLPMLGAAALGAVALFALNRARVAALWPYLLVGAVVWLCVLKSGVHPTLAGVVTALAVPLAGRRGSSPLATAEHALRPWVLYGVLPAFAFVNAGVSLDGITARTWLQGVPLGIACGLVVGKTLGVFAATWLMVRAGAGERPAGASWRQVLGVALLCGIGFTMSLFIGGLAFQGQGAAYETQLKLGVLGGSLASALLGAALLLAPVAPRRRLPPGAAGAPRPRSS